MKAINEKIPDPKKIEKEIGEFLTKKFGDNVKLVSPIVMPQEDISEKSTDNKKLYHKINFNLLPEDLVSYLDQYIIKQNFAKSILATKICTHFNRIKRAELYPEEQSEMVGSIKNNVLMIGPTGVGKTYMIRLIAKKLGVPFVKGDATKFSETGYVGGDVEDLVRDLVREADGDLDLAGNGIIYIDEIDKIASTQNLMGADVSRTGVQRALLKPMEETDVELKVPHDPISMIQEIERFRKSGKRENSTINTKNILFIMSGAFSGLDKIIKKRMIDQSIGFGARITNQKEEFSTLKQVRAEDLIEFGFETEFIGRLPVKAVFEELTENDLFDILRNPNNPIVMGKRLDFAAYDIDISFSREALRRVAANAFREHTGARGLVSSMEQALLLFENKLPSSHVKKFPVVSEVMDAPSDTLDKMISTENIGFWEERHESIKKEEKIALVAYINENKKHLGGKHNLALTKSRVNLIADYYSRHVSDLEYLLRKVKKQYDEAKKIELYFYNKQDLNIVLEEDAIDFILEHMAQSSQDFEKFYKNIAGEFEYGLKLVNKKTGRSRFFITREAMENPDLYIGNLLKGKSDMLEPDELSLSGKGENKS